MKLVFFKFEATFYYFHGKTQTIKSEKEVITEMS